MTAQEIFTSYLPNIVMYASILSAALPEPKAGSVGAAVKTLINIMAINLGHAKNKGAP